MTLEALGLTGGGHGLEEEGQILHYGGLVLEVEALVWHMKPL